MSVSQLKNIDLNLVVTLHELLRTRSVSQTAKSLGLTQPAVSNALARIRHILGDPILVRGPAGYIPTERAQKLVIPVTRALQELQQALTAPLLFNPETSERTFVVAVSDYAAATLASEIIAEVYRKAPRCKVGLRRLSMYTPVEELASGKLDICIAFRIDDYPGLRGVRLLDDRFVCIVRKDHPEVGKGLSLKKFLELKHAIVSPLVESDDDEFYGVVDDYLKKSGHRREVLLSVPYFFMAPQLVERTNFIMTVPEFLAHVFQEFSYVRILPAPFPMESFQTNLVWHERNDLDPAMVWFRQLAQKCALRLRERYAGRRAASN